MPLILKKAPTLDRYIDGVARVDGGIVIKHKPWLMECDQYIAFSLEELTPLPHELTCPACGLTQALAPWMREKLAAILAGSE